MGKDKIAFSKQDNWNKFDYDSRILDVIASLFHFKSLCAAVMIYQDKLYLSYNTQLISSDQLISTRINLVDYYIKNGSAEDLLTLYLLLNFDYIEFIKYQFKYENNKELKNTLEEFKECYKILKVDFLTILKKEKLVSNIKLDGYKISMN